MINKTDRLFDSKKEFNLKTWQFQEKNIVMWYAGGKTQCTYKKLKNFCDKEEMSEEEYQRRIDGTSYTCPYFFTDRFMQGFLEYHLR